LKKGTVQCHWKGVGSGDDADHEHRGDLCVHQRALGVAGASRLSMAGVAREGWLGLTLTMGAMEVLQ